MLRHWILLEANCFCKKSIPTKVVAVTPAHLLSSFLKSNVVVVVVLSCSQMFYTGSSLCKICFLLKFGSRGNLLILPPKSSFVFHLARSQMTERLHFTPSECQPT